MNFGKVIEYLRFDASASKDSREPRIRTGINTDGGLRASSITVETSELV